jgi:hypothetical protein
MTAILALLWIIAFPILAAVLGTLAIASVVRNGVSGAPVLLTVLAGATAILAASLSAERFAPD